MCVCMYALYVPIYLVVTSIQFPGDIITRCIIPESSNIPADHEDLSHSQWRRNKETVISRDTVRQIFLPTWQSLANQHFPLSLQQETFNFRIYRSWAASSTRDTTTSALLSIFPWACRQSILFLFRENRSIFHNFSISTWMQDILFVLHISV